MTQRRKKLFVIEKSLVKILGNNGFLKIILVIQRKIDNILKRAARRTPEGIIVHSDTDDLANNVNRFFV